MNAGFMQIRLFSKDKAAITKTIADANKLVFAHPSGFCREQGEHFDWFNFRELPDIQGKTWSNPDEWVLNERKVFVAECRVCERLNVLDYFMQSLRAAAEANGVLVADFYANPDEMHTLGALFGSSVEARAFEFNDHDAGFNLAMWLQEMDDIDTTAHPADEERRLGLNAA